MRAHRQNPNRHYTLPALGKPLADKAHREGGAEPFPAPRVRKTIELEVALSDHYDKLLGEGELYSTRPAKGHAAQSFARLPSEPGIGQIVALVILYEIQDMARCPRVQDFLASGPLLKGAKESAGNRYGRAGQKIGTPPLKGAVSEAAPLVLRQTHPGTEDFAKLERNQGKGKALTVLAQKLARAVYYLLTRPQAVDLQRLVTVEPLRGTGAPAVYLAPNGPRPPAAPSCWAASTACEPLGTLPGSPRR